MNNHNWETFKKTDYIAELATGEAKCPCMKFRTVKTSTNTATNIDTRSPHYMVACILVTEPAHMVACILVSEPAHIPRRLRVKELNYSKKNQWSNFAVVCKADFC